MSYIPPNKHSNNSQRKLDQILQKIKTLVHKPPKNHQSILVNAWTLGSLNPKITVFGLLSEWIFYCKNNEKGRLKNCTSIYTSKQEDLSCTDVIYYYIFHLTPFPKAKKTKQYLARVYVNFFPWYMKYLYSSSHLHQHRHSPSSLPAAQWDTRNINQWCYITSHV